MNDQSNITKWIITSMIIIGTNVFAVADNLYYYLEKLPKTISERDYSNFKTEKDIISYAERCNHNILNWEYVSKESLNNYIHDLIELHDIVDQFPNILRKEDGWDAKAFTIKALNTLECHYGIESREYATFYADYLLYDSKDKLSNKFVSIISKDIFSNDSTYTQYVKYRQKLFTNFFEATANTLYASKNSLSKIDFANPLYKEMLWAQLLLGKSAIPIKDLYGSIYITYGDISNPSLFKESIQKRQLFMDGTGLMLSLYSENFNNSDKNKCLEDIQTWVDIVEKSFVKISKNVSIHKRVNGIHLLAYLQGWKHFIQERGGTEADLSTIDRIVEEYNNSLPLVPNSYREAFKLYSSSDNINFENNYIEIDESDDSFLEFLSSINCKVKQNESFTQLESMLPPIIEWRLTKLKEEKEFLSLVDYSALCLQYIDNYFDSGFTWYVNYDSEETIAASKARKEKLLADGWTGKSGDQFIASDRVLDFAVDYIIQSQDYSSLSAPRLLYRAARNKLALGDYNRAMLYSKMANELFELLDSHPLEWVDNQRVIASSTKLLNNDSSLIPHLETFVSQLEDKIVLANDELAWASMRDCLLSIYCVLSDYELCRGDSDRAIFWTNCAMDFIYHRKGSKWAPAEGTSILREISQPYEIPVLYQAWKNSLATGNAEYTDSCFKELNNVVFTVQNWGDSSFDYFDMTFDVEHQTNKKWKARNEEDAVEYAINRSKNIREILTRYCTLMHPAMRNKYYALSQRAISEYNGILVKSKLEDAVGCVFNNLLAFHGLQLLNERLIASALSVDDECKILFEQYNAINGIDKQELVTLFRSDNYNHKLEERALAHQGLKELISVDYTDIQKSISDSCAVVEFFKTPYWNDFKYRENEMNDEYGFYAILLKKTGQPHIIPLCSTDELPISDSSNGYDQIQLKDLSNIILKPILNQLEGINTIYFTPDGELHNIPLEYLPLTNNKIFSDEYNTFRLSSSRVLIQNKAENHSRDIAVFGHMHYGNKFDELESDTVIEFSEDALAISDDKHSLLRAIRGTVKDLPNTQKEIYDINEIVSSNNFICTIYSENSAREEVFKGLSGNAPGIVHIATHGKYWSKLDILDDESLRNVSFLQNIFKDYNFDDALSRSVLLFSGANASLQGKETHYIDDGILTAREISLLDLSNIDLLVLSACQTALGDVHEDGVFGLQRGFKKAGVNTILMSLWEVDDEATQKLMVSFYKHLTDGTPKNISLRLAQKELRDTPGFNDPYYWAAFILLDGLN